MYHQFAYAFFPRRISLGLRNLLLSLGGFSEYPIQLSWGNQTNTFLKIILWAREPNLLSFMLSSMSLASWGEWQWMNGLIMLLIRVMKLLKKNISHKTSYIDLKSKFHNFYQTRRSLEIGWGKYVIMPSYLTFSRRVKLPRIMPVPKISKNIEAIIPNTATYNLSFIKCLTVNPEIPRLINPNVMFIYLVGSSF